MARILALLAVALLSGCTTHHYLVTREGAPAYRTQEGSQPVESLSRYHHEPLSDDPDSGPRVKIVYRGRTLYAARRDLRLFSYLDPMWDRGEARDAKVQSELRQLQLAEVGQAWSPAVKAAVLEGDVRQGFTPMQVEVAWGWPQTVEPGPIPGGQRWVYVQRGETRVRRWINPYGYWGYWGFAPPAAFSGYHPQAWSPSFYGPSTVSVKVPVTYERVVEFDAQARVIRITKRKLEH